MEIRNKVIAGIGTLGVVVVGAVAPSVTCVDEKGLMLLPATELVLREQSAGEVVETGQICFKTEKDYEALKTLRISDYLSKSNNQRAQYIMTEEGMQIDDIITHEVQKLGEVSFKLKKGDDMILKYIQALNL